MTTKKKAKRGPPKGSKNASKNGAGLDSSIAFRCRSEDKAKAQAIALKLGISLHDLLLGPIIRA